MAELTGNSFIDREGESKKPEKFEKLVTNPTELRKKNELEKIGGALSGSIFTDIVKPAAKEALSDVVSHIFDMAEDAIRMTLFPDGGGGRSRTRRRYGETVSYGGYYKSGRKRDRERSFANARSMFDVENVIFRTRGEAETVLYGMDDAIERYSMVTVGDFYDMSDVDTTNVPHTVHKYGWTDIRNARIMPTRGGFAIKFPKPMPID